MTVGCTRREWPHGAPLVAALVIVTAACAQEARPPAEAGTEVVSPNYSVRMDSESSDVGLFGLSEDEDGIRVRTGPAGIAYRSDDAVASGDLRAEATFVQYGAPPGYREAYGIFVGGRELEGPDLEYTYLLVRPTGDYLIKRRIGEITETFVDWTAHPSVRGVLAAGDEPENTLAVEVLDGETRFLVNGVAVHTLPSSVARPYGVAGLRVNHRLDVLVSDWSLGALSRGS